MSVILNNMFEFLYEAEIEIDDSFLTDLFEGKVKTAAKLAAAGAAGGGAAAYNKRLSDQVGADAILSKHGLNQVKDDAASVAARVSGKVAKVKEYASDKASVSDAMGPRVVTPSQLKQDAIAGLSKAKDFVADNSLAVGAAGATIGAGLLFKYFTSISHYKSKLASLEAKAKSASPEKKASIQSAIATVKQKLNAAQAKSRAEHGSFIEKSRQMKAQVGELNKAGRKPEAAKLQAKLDKRQKFLSKIGASV